MAVTINSKEYTGSQNEDGSWNPGIWLVNCVVTLKDGTRTGTETVQLPQEATDEQLCAAIEKAYKG